MQNLLHKYRISQPPYRHPEIVNWTQPVA